MLNFSPKRKAVKTAMKYNFSPIKLAKIQKFDNMLPWQGCGESHYPILPVRISKWYNPCEGEFGNILQNRTRIYLLTM